MLWNLTAIAYPPPAFPSATYSRRVVVRTPDERSQLRFWRPGAEAWEDEAGNLERAGRWTHWLEIPEI